MASRGMRGTRALQPKTWAIEEADDADGRLVKALPQLLHMSYTAQLLSHELLQHFPTVLHQSHEVGRQRIARASRRRGVWWFGHCRHELWIACPGSPMLIANFSGLADHRCTGHQTTSVEHKLLIFMAYLHTAWTTAGYQDTMLR